MEMSSIDAFKRKVDELQKQAEEIEKLGIKLLEEAPIEEHSSGISMSKLDYRSPLKKIQRDAVLKYQQWFSTTLRLVEEYASEWKEKFQSLYTSNSHGTNSGMDYLKLGTYSDFLSRDSLISDYLSDFETQIAILLSIPQIIEFKEMSLRELITADVARTEIEQAEMLFDSSFERAAGSVAGVALELHLKTLCDINDVSYPPKPTIQTLVQALYKEKKIDVTELKHFQYLGSIRNKCSHPEPVSAKEVQSLISEVKKIV